MKTTLTIILALIISYSAISQKIDVKKEFADAAKQYEGMLTSHPDLTKFPQSTKPNG